MNRALELIAQLDISSDKVADTVMLNRWHRHAKTESRSAVLQEVCADLLKLSG